MHATGFQDAWKSGFTITSATHPEMAGMTGKEAMSYILTGESASEADLNHSLLSESFLSSLKNQGTKVFLQVTGSDYICPHYQQVKYGNELLTRGVPSEIAVTVRSGHSVMEVSDGGKLVPLYQLRAKEALEKIIDPAFPSILKTSCMHRKRHETSVGCICKLCYTSKHGCRFCCGRHHNPVVVTIWV